MARVASGFLTVWVHAAFPGMCCAGGARCHVPPQLVGAFPLILMGIGSGPEFSAVLDKWPPQASSPLFLDRGGFLDTLLTGWVLLHFGS